MVTFGYKPAQMNKTIFAILLTFLFASAFQMPGDGVKDVKTRVIIDKSVKVRIDTTLKSFIDSNKIVGVSALVFEKGKEVYYNAFGKADREANIPMDRNTIVRIFSMTKPVTGVALMTLYDKGAVQ